MKWMLLFLRICLGGIFLYAGFIKVMDPYGFYKAIELYRMIPDWCGWGLAHYLPWLEMVAGGLLVAGVWKKEVLGILAVLLAIFLSALLLGWSRGLDLECACFGKALGALSYKTAVLRDLLLLAVAVILWRGLNACSVRSASE